MGTNKSRKMRRILLISPYSAGLEDPLAYPPLGLMYIASNMYKEWFPEILVMQNTNFTKFDYDYYGINIHSVAVYKEAFNIIEAIYKHNREAVIFVGGSGAMLFKRETSKRILIPIIGEAEKYFGNIDISNLDNIAFPARYLVPEHIIKHRGNVHHASEPSTTMIATRGCVYQCSFCDRITHGKKFRKRSIDNIVREIDQIKRLYGINWIRFIDDCITLDKRWFAELCLELVGMNIRWTCLSRADAIDMKLLYLMKTAGCQEIFFGFESGSQKMLDLMQKRITVARNKQAIKMCREVGITSCAYMMFGFPGEDAETVEATISFLEDSQPDKSRLSQFVAIPGTDVWDNPSKYNVSLKKNYEDYWYYDKHDFGLKYKYISDYKMKKLRDKLFGYYERNYKQKWTGVQVA